MCVGAKPKAWYTPRECLTPVPQFSRQVSLSSPDWPEVFDPSVSVSLVLGLWQHIHAQLQAFLFLISVKLAS